MSNEHLSPAKRALLEKLLMGQSGGDMPTILPRPANSPITLSFPQQRQLFLEILERSTAVNNLSVLLNLSGKIDHETLEQSANHIIARHEVLRTRFLFGQGMPTPEILPASPISIPIVDLRQSNQPEKINEARRLAEKEVLKPFDLTQAPLIRLKLYALSEEHYSLLVIIHHTIADGWSLGIFLRELMMFYEQITIGRHAFLPALPIQYSDFANWQIGQTGSEGFKSAMNYWKKQLQGPLPVLDLPTDEQRGPRQSFSGGTERFVLTRDLIEAVEKLCRQEDVTLFMVMLTTFYILLHRYSGQDEILVGTPIANRNLPELENLIGVFINTLVLRTKVSGECSFRELLQRVREVSVEAYTHQDLPFEKLVEELNPQRDLSRTPVF
ncbi:MAG TPA: condensation domain-containing protein, partial [Chitinophagaceae bacterium]